MDRTRRTTRPRLHARRTTRPRRWRRNGVVDSFTRSAPSRPVCDLSSGQQLRLALALALARRPRVLLVDEPTNHLDVRGLIWLESVLNDAVRRGVVGAVVAVSHDRAFLETSCTHILDAAGGGATLYAGGYSDYLSARSLRAETLSQRTEEEEEEEEEEEGEEEEGSEGEEEGAVVVLLLHVC